MAVVTATRTAELDDVIQRMSERGSTVTKADIVSVLEDFQGALESLLAEGANINLPFANYSTSIKGVFKDQTQSRHCGPKHPRHADVHDPQAAARRVSFGSAGGAHGRCFNSRVVFVF